MPTVKVASVRAAAYGRVVNLRPRSLYPAGDRAPGTDLVGGEVREGGELQSRSGRFEEGKDLIPVPEYKHT